MQIEPGKAARRIFKLKLGALGGGVGGQGLEGDLR